MILEDWHYLKQAWDTSVKYIKFFKGILFSCQFVITQNIPGLYMIVFNDAPELIITPYLALSFSFDLCFENLETCQ